MRTSQEILNAILEKDPDGQGYREPTEADYAAFDAWVVATYGKQALDEYMNWTKQS